MRAPVSRVAGPLVPALACLLALALVVQASAALAALLGGVVVFWHSARRYGFICPDAGGLDFFVHRSAIWAPGVDERDRTLEEGWRVSFTPGWDPAYNRVRTFYVERTDTGSESQFLQQSTALYMFVIYSKIFFRPPHL